MRNIPPVEDLLAEVLETSTLKNLALQVVRFRKSEIIESPLTDLIDKMEKAGYPLNWCTHLAVSVVEDACVKQVIGD